MKTKNNYFGRTLEKFLLTSEVKNYTVAKALNYDVSYISKWISSAALPSRKNAEQIMETIADTISEQAKPEARDLLCRHLGVTDAGFLKKTLKDRLMEAYAAAAGQPAKEKYFNNAAFAVFPDEKESLMLEFSEKNDGEKPVRAAVMADLFALDSTAKLYFAGIENNRFRIRKRKDRVRLDYIICLESLRGENVYDVILLIHMLAHFSLTDFHLSCSRSAQGKLLFAVDDQYAGVTLLSDRRPYLCTTSLTDQKDVTALYDAILAEQNPDLALFLSTSMDDMLKNHEYVRSLLSKKNQWLAGHVTEHFLSPEIFGRLSEEIWANCPEIRKEADRSHAMIVNALQQGTDLLIYDTALTGFVMTGEVDFFNHKVILPPEERKKQLLHMYRLLENCPGLQVRMVRGGFSDDFKYITNPCMFLSEATDYLRLENKCYENNILLVRDQKLQAVFHTFFDEIWNRRPDVVQSDRQAVSEKLKSLLEAADILAGIETD